MDFLLLETGDHMLQETGDALLLDALQEPTAVCGSTAVLFFAMG